MRFGILLLAASLLGVPRGHAADATVSFQRDIEPLFAKECAFCHSKDGAQAGLVLESPFAYAAIVNVPSGQSALRRVMPGNPEQSYLLLKMQNVHRSAGGTGRKMPPGWLEVIAEETELVRAWIAAGAPDN